MILAAPPEPARTIDEVLAALGEHGADAAVPPRGRADRGLVLVSDRVSGFEVASGQLFAGPFERILLKILAAPDVEIPMDWLYFTAAIRRSLPRNRAPRMHEIVAARPRLHAELALMEPLVVVALGSLAASAVWADGAAPLAGEWGECVCGEQPVPAFLTAHPRDALCRIPLGGDQAPGGKRRMYDDWQAISARFRQEVTREFGGGGDE